MQPITRIYVAGYRYDAEFNRCCVASIREWHPDIPIFLIKDKFYGDYYTKDIERYWNVQIYDVGDKVFGWGFSKLEPLFENTCERFLVLDSDIIVLGDIVSRLEEYDGEFIVRGHQSDDAFQADQYFDPKDLAVIDEDYRHNGIGFNTGQWVGTSGIFKRHELEQFVYLTNPPKLRHPEIFQLGEQGLLNYFLFKNQDLGRIKITSVPFMEIGTNPVAEQVLVKGRHLTFDKSLVLHWAGCRGKTPEQSPNGHLFSFFANRFNEKVPWGYWRRWMRDCRSIVVSYLKGAGRRLLLPLRT